MTKNILLISTIVVSLLTIISCSKDKETPTPTTPTTVSSIASTTQKLNINISGLEDLGSNFVYEGWLIVSGTPISTGRFTSFKTADNGNPFSGSQNNAEPPIPGEDFLLNPPTGETFPLDLRGRRLVISIEPSPDNSPNTFLLKPLLIDLSATANLALSTHNFVQNLGSLPAGTVTR